MERAEAGWGKSGCCACVRGVGVDASEQRLLDREYKREHKSNCNQLYSSSWWVRCGDRWVGGWVEGGWGGLGTR